MNDRRTFLVLVALALAACGYEEPLLTDRDAGPRPDAGADPDGGPMPDPDAGPMPDPDAGPLPDPDAGPPPPACGDPTWTPPTSAGVGRWDTSFSLPGVGGTAPADALSIAVGASDEIYVGGMFSHAGSLPANNVVKWTSGGGWEPLGDGIDGDVLALAVHPTGSPVYAAAYLYDVWQVEILAWNGTVWSTVVNLGDADVSELAVGSDGALYVGGSFSILTTTGSIDNFAIWQSGAWSNLGGANPDSDVGALLVDRSGVCIGGHFSQIGGSGGGTGPAPLSITPAQNVACWDGTEWSARSLPLPYYSVEALARDASGALLAGGHFTLDESDTSQGGSLARWNGTAWEYVGGGVHLWPGTAGYVEGIAVVGTDIYVGGYFGMVGSTGGGVLVRDVAKWDGTTWHDLGGVYRDMGIGIIEQNVRRAVADSLGNVFFTGMFTSAGSRSAQHVAMWDGSYWNNLVTSAQTSAGVNGSVLAFASYGTCGLYVGGSFQNAGDIVANNVARYDTSTGWHELGGGLDGEVRALAVDASGGLYAGGSFTGTGFYNLGYFDGTAWRGAGNANGTVTSLLVDDGRLYVGGEFTVAGDATAAHIAVYEEGAWRALGDGLDGPPHAMMIDAEGHLVVAGRFENAGGAPAANIARWDGTAWSTYGDGLPGYSPVHSLAMYGGRLVAAGSFDALSDGSSGVAVWDGSAWAGLGGGLHGRYSWSTVYVNGLGVAGDTLFAVGFFSLESGADSVNVAYYDGTAWQALGTGTGFNDIGEIGYLDRHGFWAGGVFTKADDTPSVAIARWIWP